MGAEIRTDEFKVTAGDEYSYRDYDTDEFGNSLYPDDRSAGTQGFGGTAPMQAVDETRDVISFYIDAETEVTEDILVSGAVRYDDYEGFGDSTNFKLAANWSITEDITIRGAMSTGFRDHQCNNSTLTILVHSSKLTRQILGVIKLLCKWALFVTIPT